MRTLVTALASVVMALFALGLALAAPHRGGPAEPKAAIDDASGALLISNSRAGEAVFSAPPMAPGETVSGDVRIGNAGQLPGRFSVAVTGVHDAPGPYGGRLSQRVQLALIDITGTPVTMYAGTAAGLAGVDLGTIAAGGQRDYRLSATLPDGGLTDNSFQGAALSFDLAWNAVATDPGSGGGGGGTGGAGGGGVTPTVPGTPPADVPVPPADEVSELEVLGDTLGLPSASGCINRLRGMKLRLRGPGGVRVLAATVRINGKLKKRVANFKRRTVTLRKLPGKRFRLTVRVRAANKRVYVSKRVYRACTAKKTKRNDNRGWRKRAA